MMLPPAFLLLLVSWLSAWLPRASAMSADRMAQLRKETVSMFYHGFDNYMEHAFPEDELRPVTCTPLTRDRENELHYGVNDVLGNYSLTLIDSLSTLAILASSPPDDPLTGKRALADFQDGIAQFVKYYGDGRVGPSGQGLRARGFDLDSKVQVFETVIRGVGGLLSAHLFAIGELPITGYKPGPRAGKPVRDDPLELHPIKWSRDFKYDGQLLRLALDLAQRLLPAFYSDTGIPYPRVNLRHGIPFYVNSPLNENTSFAGSTNGPERTETCSAGAGSLVLEFTTLSRLSGDARFEQLGKRAFWEVWDRRSEIGLVGNRIDPEDGRWLDLDTGIGAGIDSFFEYALKSHILLSGQGLPNMTMPEPRRDRAWLDPNSLYHPLSAERNSPSAFLEAWHKAHAAVKRHLYEDVHHPHYITGNLRTGSPVAQWIDSLGAFYPGLLALAGEVEEAVKSNLLYTALWTRYAALPERWNYRENAVWSGIGWWPGRPEFIESTYHIYRATKDPWYLYVGEMVLQDIKRRCHTECGWSGLQDVRTGEKMDRMESFFLGETTKYMYLLFDPDHPLNKLDAAYVFTTEGHPIIIPRRRASRSSPAKAAATKDVVVYYDDSYTNSCPVAPSHLPLSISATAARRDVFHASSFTNLHSTPNIHGEIELVASERTESGTRQHYRAKTNYTFFPWTLPMQMVPADGMCDALPGRQSLTIEFPSSAQQAVVGGAFNQFFGNPAVSRVDHQAVYVHHLNALRLMLVMQDATPPDVEPTWRVTSVNNIALGRDEVVYVEAEVVADMSDPLFNRVRHQGEIDVIIASGPPEPLQASEAASVEASSANETQPGVQEDGFDVEAEVWAEDLMDQLMDEGGGSTAANLDGDYKSLLKSLVRAMTSVFEPLATTVSQAACHASSGAARGGEDAPALEVHSFVGALPVGRGAVPAPDVPDVPPASRLAGTLGQSSSAMPDPASSLPWSRVYMGGLACDARLPDDAPRHHQVIVLRRGGCPFAQKLANIPAYAPSPQALQLVVVVGDLDDGAYPDRDDRDGADGLSDEQLQMLSLVRPRLDDEQRTPTGLRRHHPIPMVLVQGRDAYDAFRDAVAVGIRRRYYIEVQGLRADNIHVL